MKQILIILVSGLFAQVSFAEESFLAEGYQDGQKFTFVAQRIPVLDLRGRSVVLEASAAEAFKELIVGAAKAGHYIGINYGYRTYAQQNFWYKKFQARCKDQPRYCGMAAKPGYSTHQAGKSIDISGSIRHYTESHVESLPQKIKEQVKNSCKQIANGKYICKTTLYWWLKRNAKTYGFQNDVPEEPWHWTYYKSDQIEVGG